MDEHSSPRKVSGTKRAAQSAPGRGYHPMPSGSRQYAPAPTNSSGRGFQPLSSAYVPAPFQPSSYSGPMSQRSYVPASVLGLVHKKRPSYPFTQPLAPPQGQRPRQISKRPVRQVDSSPISTRRIMASTTSASMPVKSAQYNLPHWQVTDSASARATDSRRFAAMSVGDRSAANPEYRNITRTKFAYSNENVRKEYDSAGPQYARKAARKNQEQALEDEESTSESSESDLDSDGRETVPSDEQSEEDQPDELESSDDDSVEIIEPEPFKHPVIELLDDTPPMLPAQGLPSCAPPDQMLVAIESLTLSVARMQKIRTLPFLKRNLRRGFRNYCCARGVRTQTKLPFSSIIVVFTLEDSDLPPHEASISCHECPLCDLHFPFQTKEMLKMHLEIDHCEVQTSWNEIDQENIRLVLVLPSKREDVRMSPTRTESPSDGTSKGLHEVSRPEPIPPPFGPTARFPFLPAKSEYGGQDVNYSVRLGGPKIYDLLSTLPMEPFGILGWSILDKEEEIFESDDMPDEHKVMHALWARWIHFNRNLFIMNYFEGTKSFIDEYWKMIRLAAGSNALRYWLVMLITNRYLNGREVALLIRHYEALCKD